MNHSEETKAKIRQAILVLYDHGFTPKQGKAVSLETRKRMGEARKIKTLDESMIVKKYVLGECVTDLAKENNVDWSVIARILREHNIKPRTWKEQISLPTLKNLQAHQKCSQTHRLKGIKPPSRKGTRHTQGFFEKAIPKIIKKLRDWPTPLEKEFINLCEEYSLPFLYCGDGSLMIGSKNPDFVESNGEKICLEVVHRRGVDKKYEISRQQYFAKYSWKCLVIWEREFKDKPALVDKIRRFLVGREVQCA